MVSIFENCKLFFRFVHLILKLIDQAEKSPGLVRDPRPLTPTINICLFVNAASDCFWVPSYANETYTSHDQQLKLGKSCNFSLKLSVGKLPLLGWERFKVLQLY
jgi:hypothetical protein